MEQEIVPGVTEEDEDAPNVEDEEVLRLKLEDRARQKRKEERDAIKEREDRKVANAESMFSSQKQRNLREAKKWQIRKQAEV